MDVNQYFLDRKCWSCLLPNYPIPLYPIRRLPLSKPRIETEPFPYPHVWLLNQGKDTPQKEKWHRYSIQPAIDVQKNKTFLTYNSPVSLPTTLPPFKGGYPPVNYYRPCQIGLGRLVFPKNDDFQGRTANLSVNPLVCYLKGRCFPGPRPCSCRTVAFRGFTATKTPSSWTNQPFGDDFVPVETDIGDGLWRYCHIGGPPQLL